MPSKLSEIDEILIRYADSESPNAISFRIDGILTPEQVQARIVQLLDSPDWLTQVQQQSLVTLKMRQLVARFEDLPLTARNGEVMLRGLESIGARLDNVVQATEKDLHTFYAFQGAAFLDAVLVALNHMRSTVLPEADTDLKEVLKWDDQIETALRLAQIEMKQHDQNE